MGTVAALCRELTADRRTDGELLAAFTSGDSEDAFSELIRWHGPLVWGACRRLLPNPADAEDAFQAAFLVLVRRARRLTHYPALGPWLHRAAVWTAHDVRRKNARRGAKQRPLPDHLSDPAAPPDPDLKADLDAALLALPSRYRESIILCHLQGFSRREAAERLGCPEGTLSAWLHRGLAKLRDRLRDSEPLKLPALALAVPPALAVSTAHAATATAVAGAAIPPAIHSLVEGVLHMFWVKKATAASLALFATFALGVGIGVGSRTEFSGAAAGDGPTGPGLKVKSAPSEREWQIAELQAQLAIATERYERALQSANTAAAATLPDAAARFRKDADYAVAEMKLLKENLAALKAAKAKPAADPFAEPQPPAAAEIDEKLRELRRQLDQLQHERAKLDSLKKQTDEQAAKLDKQIRDILEAAKALQAKREELEKHSSASGPGPGAYLELKIYAKGDRYEYSLSETDAGGKPFGTAILREQAMLQKLLARAKADPTAPKELRVTVDPPASLTGFPVAALTACDAAGYKTVKFTGYVFGGGYATPLKPDQKGEVGGYKRYQDAEKKPAELIKEIEEGMRRY